jgi:hypothetical protein
LAKKLPQGTDKTPEVLDSALKGLSDRWVFFNPIYRENNLLDWQTNPILRKILLGIKLENRSWKFE